MKRIILAIALCLAAIGATAPAAGAVTDNGTGVFWVYDSANGTGQYRDFNVGPNQTLLISTMKYVGGCPVGGCGFMDNTISSVRLSCGSAATSFSALDYVLFYGSGTPSGTAYKVSRGTRTCSNGSILFVFDSTHNNWASSAVTHDGG